mmetsp:Transcript_4848/g.30930  ORF Transcript_4848/g.30930 Transcript_4848/m.30930 type:complete len:86 (-) Transcript_4848:2654-2911(-)
MDPTQNLLDATVGLGSVSPLGNVHPLSRVCVEPKVQEWDSIFMRTLILVGEKAIKTQLEDEEVSTVCYNIHVALGGFCSLHQFET